MGYYSDFKVKFKNIEDFSIKERVEIYDFCDKSVSCSLNVITEAIKENNGIDKAYKNDKLIPVELDIYNVKWYYYQEDLERLSFVFPKLQIEVIRTGEDRWDIEKFYIENMRKKFSKGVVVFENFEEKLQLDKTDDVEDKKMYINLLIHSTTDSEVIKVLNNELKRLENEK